ncbi:GNMT methyltransferase, partial [Chloropsis hardwickii]|nr:GNMT methyltransferase [Chloropsis hardwickii]
QVTSVDASDKMLKYALKERWERRKEEPFDRWVIEEANWLTLEKDLEKPGDGFDAVICLGNSFAHLPDFKGELGQGREGGAPVRSTAPVCDMSGPTAFHGHDGLCINVTALARLEAHPQTLPSCSKFRLSYYPHRLEAFTALLKGAFQGKCQHSVLGDFQPYTPGQAHVPCYFIHVVKKT